MTSEMILYAAEQGRGFPLVLLHGNGEDHTYFQAQMTAFAVQYHVIAVDTRGHGKSPRGSAPFHLHQFADDLYHLLTSMGISKAHILGFSDGANIAILFALRYPEMIGKLILNGANLYPAGVKMSVQFPIVCGYAVTAFLGKFSQNARKKKEILGLMVHEPQLKPEDLHAIHAPTMVLVGNRDMIKASHSRQIAEALPCGVFCEMEGSHFIARDNPIEYNRCVLEFLEETETSL